MRKRDVLSQFPKHIRVVVSSGSAALCVCVCCVCLSQKTVHYVDDAVTAVGILDEHWNIKSHWEKDVHTHTNTHTRLLPLVWPWWASIRNRECVTKHVLSDSHAIFLWSRPLHPFMLRLPGILWGQLLWARPCRMLGGCIALQLHTSSGCSLKEFTWEGWRTIF